MPLEHNESRLHVDVGQVTLTPVGTDKDKSGFVWTAIDFLRAVSGQLAGQQASRNYSNSNKCDRFSPGEKTAKVAHVSTRLTAITTQREFEPNRSRRLIECVSYNPAPAGPSRPPSYHILSFAGQHGSKKDASQEQEAAFSISFHTTYKGKGQNGAVLVKGGAYGTSNRWRPGLNAQE